MDEPTPAHAPDPGERPPAARRLATPPSARYGPGDRSAMDAGPGPRAGTGNGARSGTGSSPVGRAFVRAALAALLGAAAIFVLEGLLSVTTGLVAAMAATGWIVGRAINGAGDALTASTGLALALFLVVDAVVLGNLLTWLNAVVVEGGVLGPIDYLAETFGLLIVVEIAAGAVAAWAATRR